MNKNKDLLAGFTKYCEEHPEQRFWQALRNWAGVAFVLTSDDFDFTARTYSTVQDTFYWDNKNN